nr:hypothetical protein [Glaciibacter flavus]
MTVALKPATDRFAGGDGVLLSASRLAQMQVESILSIAVAVAVGEAQSDLSIAAR